MSTAIFNAKLYASFFLIYHLMKTFAAVKINEAVGKRVRKVSKIRYVILINRITSIRIPSSEPFVMLTNIRF